MMHQIIRNLVARARSEHVVVSQALENGMTMLAYPTDSGAVLGIGFDADQSHRVQLENLLRLRATNLSRFGAWLPTAFMDGSCYVVTRIASDRMESDEEFLSNLDVQIAQELLS